MKAFGRPESCGRVSEADLSASMRRTDSYCNPYQDLLTRREQRENLSQMIGGLVSALERKSVEPIAVMHGVERRNLQHFVGTSQWDDDPLRHRQRWEVAQEIGVADGSLVLDGSGTIKKGTETVAVARQWCGRQGKVDNCVVGIYAAYVGKGNLASIVDSQICLPREWADDPDRRAKVYVPPDIEYRSQTEIALEMNAQAEGRASVRMGVGGRSVWPRSTRSSVGPREELRLRRSARYAGSTRRWHEELASRRAGENTIDPQVDDTCTCATARRDHSK